MNDKIKKRIRITAAVVITLAAAVIGIIISKTYIPQKPDDVMRAVFFDVGEGDCMLFYGSGCSILIDAPYGSAVSVEGYLQRFGIKKIDCFVITHFDSDHCGDAVKIIRDFDVVSVMMPDDTGGGSYYDRIRNETSAEQRLYAVTGDKFVFGEVGLEVMAPNRSDVSDANGMCIAAKLTYGKSAILCCSDITAAEERIMTAKYKDRLSSDILKVSHHGSAYSTTDDFINCVKPDYAVISCGKNSYGHPSFSVIDKLKNAGTEVAVTQTDGVVIFDISSAGVERIK